MDSKLILISVLVSVVILSGCVSQQSKSCENNLKLLEFDGYLTPTVGLGAEDTETCFVKFNESDNVYVVDTINNIPIIIYQDIDGDGVYTEGTDRNILHAVDGTIGENIANKPYYYNNLLDKGYLGLLSSNLEGLGVIRAADIAVTEGYRLSLLVSNITAEPKCGDGNLDLGEQCEVGIACANPNNICAVGICRCFPVPKPFCGDGRINQWWEQCEPPGALVCPPGGVGTGPGGGTPPGGLGEGPKGGVFVPIASDIGIDSDSNLMTDASGYIVIGVGEPVPGGGYGPLPGGGVGPVGPQQGNLACLPNCQCPPGSGNQTNGTGGVTPPWGEGPLVAGWEIVNVMDNQIKLSGLEVLVGDNVFTCDASQSTLSPNGGKVDLEMRIIFKELIKPPCVYALSWNPMSNSYEEKWIGDCPDAQNVISAPEIGEWFNSRFQIAEGGSNVIIGQFELTAGESEDIDIEKLILKLPDGDVECESPLDVSITAGDSEDVSIKSNILETPAPSSTIEPMGNFEFINSDGSTNLKSGSHIVVASSGTPDITTQLPITLRLVRNGQEIWTKTIPNEPELNCRGPTGCSGDGPSDVEFFGDIELTATRSSDGTLLATYTNTQTGGFVWCCHKSINYCEAATKDRCNSAGGISTSSKSECQKTCEG